ncbi:MAG: iron chelate uptake ABC transporter family permease subunit [Kiritimatiellae bacterium]|nr:iron chelate uptake ABC transporter family permease subunit [Kiritimatiellia bacterium]
MPTWDQLIRVLTLRDYNTRVVVLGTLFLGSASGVIGTFMFLRKRALVGDAASHAALPGIGLAFIVMASVGGDGKYLPGLLLGAFISGLIGMGFILLIRHFTRLKEDAALGIVLSVFFGLGISILGVIQKMNIGHAAGLESFIYGKTASMLAQDAYLMGGAALVVTLLCGLLFKEFSLLCFDQDFACSQGWPVLFLDTLIMALVVAVTVMGLQAVGLILMVALLIIPPAAARFWTHHLYKMIFISAAIGSASGLLGAALSALVPRLPAGAIIVLITSSIFLMSLVFGPARGVLSRSIEQWTLNRKVASQHLLRAMYEWAEIHKNTQKSDDPLKGMTIRDLFGVRSWSHKQLKRILLRAQRQGMIYRGGDRTYHFTENGEWQSKRVVRNHRLWELYLVTHADIAPSHVDRDADQIEHVLERSMVDKLEKLLLSEHPNIGVIPPSPHDIGSKGLKQRSRK